MKKIIIALVIALVVSLGLNATLYIRSLTWEARYINERTNHLNTIKVLTNSIQSYDDLSTSQHDWIKSLQIRLGDIIKETK